MGIVYDAVGMVLWLWVMMGVDVNPGWEGVCVGDIMSMREGRLVGEFRFCFFFKKKEKNQKMEELLSTLIEIRCSSL